MKKILLLILGIFLCLPSNVFAVEAEFEWLVSLNGNHTDEFADVAITSENNYVAVGYSRSTDLDFVSNSNNNHNVAVMAMYDENGKLIFNSGYNNLDDKGDRFYSVVVTEDDLIYVAGMVSGDPAIFKYNMNGELLKLKIFDNSGTFYSISDNEDGTFIVAGELDSNAFIVKIDNELNVLFEKSIDGSGNDKINQVYKMNDGTFIVTGFTNSIELGGYKNENASNYSVFNAKVDDKGNVKWVKFYDSNIPWSYDYFKGVKTKDDRIIFVYSDWNYNHNVDEGCFSKIFKFDTNGNVVWERKIDGVLQDHLVSAVEFEDGSILASGFTNSSDLAVNNTVSFYDGLLVLLDKDGNVKWIRNYEPGEVVFFFFSELDNYGDLVFAGINYNSGATGFSSQETSLMKFKINYEIEKNESSNGTYDVIQNGAIGNITVTPDEGYIVDDVVVKDSQDNNVDVTEVEKNKFEFIITNDVITNVTFERDYKILLNVGDNGSATSEKLEDNNGRIKVVPDEGYEVDEVIIKDSTGKVLVYEEKDGIYNFKLTYDVTVTVTFKEGQKEVVKGEEENPKTADAFIYYACAIVCSLFGVWSVEQYRKNIKA